MFMDIVCFWFIFFVSVIFSSAMKHILFISTSMYNPDKSDTSLFIFTVYGRECHITSMLKLKLEEFSVANS